MGAPVRRSGVRPLALAATAASLLLLFGPPAFVGGPAAERTQVSALRAAKGKDDELFFTTPTGKRMPKYGVRGPLPKGYGIRTGLSDLLKPLNSEAGVTAKEESLGTYVVLLTAIVLLFLFYVLLLLINNQSVLLPPEDEFDEYVANFLPYFFFGEK